MVILTRNKYLHHKFCKNQLVFRETIMNIEKFLINFRYVDLVRVTE